MENTVKKEEYQDEHLRDEVKTERIRGVIYEMASPTVEHGDVSMNLGSFIHEKLRGHPCKVYMGNLELACDNDAQYGDYVVPDIMIACDREQLKGHRYYGVPKFVAEVLSKSTANRDKFDKFKIYQTLGVDEYWILTPNGFLEIYYLEGTKYKLQDYYDLCRDKNSNNYNECKEITLRQFPNIAIKLGQIYEQ